MRRVLVDILEGSMIIVRGNLGGSGVGFQDFIADSSQPIFHGGEGRYEELRVFELRFGVEEVRGEGFGDEVFANRRGGVRS